MSRKVDAWVLHAGDGKRPVRTQLVRETIELPALGDHGVRAQPLYGTWEGNMGHALNRKPVDICVQRGEPKVVIGNAGVVKILEVGRKVKSVEPGQNAIIFCTGVEDRWGYPVKIMAYDAPGTMGCLAKEMVLTDRQVIPLPENTRHSLPQWSAFSLRYVTAWSNWELAHGVFRLLLSKDEYASPNVWGWGGGVTYAELDLARRHGARAVMLSGNTRHLEKIQRLGITTVDRRTFGELVYNDARYKSDLTYREEYRKREDAFIDEVKRRTHGEMVQIFLDYVGSPVYRATLRALSREGVIATAGWKEGMEIWHLRAKECIERHQHIYTHYARYDQGVRAVAYAETNDWMPEIDEKAIYSFDEIPQLAEDYEAGKTSIFPCFSVNPD
jgi:NADPH:quinone reductase-like Zn-dependent oxidoreductase